MRPPLLWRLVNTLRRAHEDRQVEPYTFVQQMRRLWEPERPKVLPFLNLRIVRSAHRRVA